MGDAPPCRPQATERLRLVELVGLILGSYGRLEALFVGLTANEAERPLADGGSAISILQATIVDAAATATNVRAAI